MSFYDYAHESVFLARRLSKRTSSVTRKWENALSDVCKSMTIFIDEINCEIMDDKLRFREAKFFNLALELRRQNTS
jgi:hypothetical protein